MLVNGADLHVDAAGPEGAPAVVLLHAFPLSSAMWEGQREALRGEFRVAAFDFRGHGRSPAGDGLYTLDLLVDDLLGVMDGLGMERAALVGLSMGGYVALRAAERAPGRLAALVLADTRSEADGNEGKERRAAAMRFVAEHGAAAFARTFLPTVLAPGTLASRPAVADRVRRMVEGNPPLGIRGTLLALAARGDATQYLSMIQVPALVIVGEHDALTPPDGARALAAAIPGARLEVIPGAAHLPNLENRSAFDRALLGFLRGLPR